MSVLTRQFPVSRSSSPATDIIRIRRTNRRYQLPEEGLDLPSELNLPQATSPRQTIVNFGNSLGFTMPASLNRQELIERIRTMLEEIGYQTTEQTRLVRARPVRLDYYDQTEVGPRGLLPENIPSSTREQGSYEFVDLVTPEIYVEFLRSPDSILVTQEDLVRLNMSLNEIIGSLSSRRWPSFEEFIQNFGRVLGINPELAALVSLLARLPREPNSVLVSILQELGSTHRYTRTADRLNAIYSFFRAKLQLIPRTYPRRDQFHGNATTTMSFVEALEGGYIFGVEQYRQEIDDLLNQNAVPLSHRRFFVETIQNYPQIFPVMRLYNSNRTSLASSLIQLYYPETPSEVQILYAFAVNYPLIFPESDEQKARRQQLTRLPRIYLQTLYGIYQTNDLGVILETPVHPLETYLLAIKNLEPQQLPTLVAGFGMIVPEHLLTREIRGYVLLWMPQYRQIITRAPPIPNLSELIHQRANSVRDLINLLEIYTDQEIITYFGYTGGFNSRNALIENIFRTINETGFMVYKEIDTERATNTETVMLTEIRDLMGPYLVFGTPFSYRVHELDEFIQAWSESGEFRRIDGEGNYTIAQVSRLQYLLPLMRGMNPQLSTKIERILERIREGILSTMRRNAEVDEIIRDLREASPRAQELVRDIFFKVFYAGMYMRRWRGPGNRYPLRSKETLSGSTPEPQIILTLGQLYEQLNLLRQEDERTYYDLLRLPEITYNTRADDLIIRRTRIFDTIRAIYRGDLCIRQASLILVISGHYYLGVCFREVIPDFSPYDVESIA